MKASFAAALLALTASAAAIPLERANGQTTCNFFGFKVPCHRRGARPTHKGPSPTATRGPIGGSSGSSIPIPTGVSPVGTGTGSARPSGGAPYPGSNSTVTVGPTGGSTGFPLPTRSSVALPTTSAAIPSSYSTAASTTAVPTLPPVPTSEPAPTTSAPAGASPTGSTGYTGGSTASDVDDGVCAALTVIYARGTSEIGTVGYVTGPGFFKDLSADVGGKVALQGVSYPADSAGNANAGASGGVPMAAEVKKALSQCPDTKLVLSGYSQGAMVVHNALSAQGVDASKVAAIVVFGDPFNGRSDFKGVDNSKVLSLCGDTDTVCAGGPNNVAGDHGSYPQYSDQAADFVVKTTGATAA